MWWTAGGWRIDYDGEGGNGGIERGGGEGGRERGKEDVRGRRKKNRGG